MLTTNPASRTTRARRPRGERGLSSHAGREKGTRCHTAPEVRGRSPHVRVSHGGDLVAEAFVVAGRDDALDQLVVHQAELPRREHAHGLVLLLAEPGEGEDHVVREGDRAAVGAVTLVGRGHVAGLEAGDVVGVARQALGLLEGVVGVLAHLLPGGATHLEADDARDLPASPVGEEAARTGTVTDRDERADASCGVENGEIEPSCGFGTGTGAEREFQESSRIGRGWMPFAPRQGYCERKLAKSRRFVYTTIARESKLNRSSRSFSLFFRRYSVNDALGSPQENHPLLGGFLVCIKDKTDRVRGL